MEKTKPDDDDDDDPKGRKRRGQKEKERRTSGVQRDRRDAKRRAMADVAKRRGYSPTENLDSTHVSARRASPRARLRGGGYLFFAFLWFAMIGKARARIANESRRFQIFTRVLIPSSEMENIN